MVIQLIFAICLAFIVTVSGHYYIYHRIFYPILYPDYINIGYFCVLLLWGLSFFGFALLRVLPQGIRKFFEIIMFTWLGSSFVFLLICVATLPFDLYFGYFHFPKKDLSLFILLVSSVTILYALFQALRRPAIISVSIPVNSSLPSGIEDVSIVVISDIHVSGLIGKRKMLDLTKRINGLNPDLICITGDLMDGSLNQLKNEIEPLKHLNAKHGVFYVTGNHEYYSGPLTWKDHFENYFNWTILSNESKVLNINEVTLNFLGIEDKHWLSYEKIPRKHDRRLEKAVEHLFFEYQNQLKEKINLENSLNILLAHQPKDAKYLKKFPWINLQISGHTHGGQLWPLHYLVKKDQKYNVGLYKIRKNQYIYVNQGTGFWGPPMRLGSRAEITFMKFKKCL